MKHKLFILLLSALVAAPFAMAQSLPTGWQVDADGSVTGTPNEEYVFLSEENFPCSYFRSRVQSFFTTGQTYVEGTSVRYLTKTNASVLKTTEFPTDYGGANYSYYNRNITSYKGIEFLIGITKFTGDYSDCLTDRTLDLSKNENLWRLRCSNSNIAELILPESKTVTYIDCSGNYDLHTIDASRIPNITQLQIGRCFFTQEFYLENHPELSIFTCQGTGKTNIDVHGDANLTRLQFKGNHIRTLDLSYIGFNEIASSSDFNCQGQTDIEDLTVLDHNRVGIYMKNGIRNAAGELDGSLFHDLQLNGEDITPVVETVDGKDYLIIGTADDKKDIDFLYNKVTYIYDYLLNTQYVRPDFTKGAANAMDVELTLYPYVMYVNPATMAKSSDFYSGTLYLDYPSVVPVGCEAYVATGLRSKGSIMYRPENVTETQLVLEKLGGAGTIIPANTPIYVKATTESGLYGWNRAWSSKITGFDQSTNTYLYADVPFKTTDVNPATGENYTKADPELLARNILQGTLTEENFGAMAVLTLGRENSNGGGSGEVGFWRNRSGKVGAHRCYIPADVLNSASQRGASFLFTDEDEATLNIGETEYATYYNSDATILPEGVEAAVVTATSSDQLHIDWRYTGGDVLPGGTAVILRGPAGTSFDIETVDDNTDAPADNLLDGSDFSTTTYGDGLHYKLSTNADGRLGFYFGAANGQPFTSAAHKAWLVVPAESAVRSYALSDATATSVATPAVSTPTDSCYYDLQGRRVLQPRKGGVYVGSDGRKTLIR
ncbi:MAG: hypothetical protein J6N92_05515 [Alloprevotella sp.]|nr:hypothetical protein [Alloprevotella sp.]